MNIKCVICSDILVANADIVTTPCGHLFHNECLLQWIDRSRSCPQCRSKTTEKTIHRIFVSVDDSLLNTSDVGTLQNQIDNLNFQLKLKTMDVDKANERLKLATAHELGLRKEFKSLEDKIKLLDTATYALKDQIKYFKSKSKERNRLEEEVVVLKNKIAQLENVQLVITGTREAVTDMLRHNRDPDSLSVLVSTLKKELIDSDRQKKQLEVMFRDTQSDVNIKMKEIMALTKENTKLLTEVDAHKNCASERQYLKKRIDQLKETATHNSSINRILQESPVPLANDKHCSPSLPDKVQAIKESDSPYLRVQSSSIGLSDLMNFNIAAPKRKSIFKTPLFDNDSFWKPSSFVSYDGLGGHSQNEHIPTERSLILNIKKRPKSSSSIPSAKLRKVAPQQKIQKFFDLTDESL